MKKIIFLLCALCLLSIHGVVFAQLELSAGGESLRFESRNAAVRVASDLPEDQDVKESTKHSSRGHKSARVAPILSSKEATSAESLVISETPLETKKIHLRVETTQGTLYNEDLEVAPCATSPTNPTEVISAFCAISQSGLNPQWNWWGESAFLESLGGIANDNNAGIYWFWFSNLTFAEDLLNTHELSEGEELLLSFGVFPMKLSLSTMHPTVGETLAVSVYEFGFDENWNPAWMLSTDSTVVINGENFPNPTGVYNMPINSDSRLNFSGVKQGFIQADSVSVNPVFVASRNIHRSSGPVHTVAVDQSAKIVTAPVPEPRVVPMSQPIIQPVSKTVAPESQNPVVAPQKLTDIAVKPQTQQAMSFVGWPKDVAVPSLIFFGFIAAGVVIQLLRSRALVSAKS